ncbi:HIT domain-containing protein [Candidatus Gottesmanbacteria bacterium]|nr:HIT domain-containing protein [Candidatus Gottesmanbacteria bacterium]
MDNCIFCQVISGKLPGTFLYKDDDVVVIKDIHPQAAVHYLVISKKHVPELVEADDALLMKVMSTVKKIIKEHHIANYRIVNNGQGAALIDHMHVHVLGSIDKFRKL